MAMTPDLDRIWTLGDVTEALRAQGIVLTLQAGGYRLNFRTDGTASTEYVTDDLIDALVTGFAMAGNPPPPRRARRRFHSPYRLGRNGALRKRPKKRRH